MIINIRNMMQETLSSKSERQIPSVRLNEGQGLPYPILDVELEAGIKHIPVYSVRDTQHHEMIAKAMASGAVVAFEVGVMGVMIAISNDPSKQDSGWKKFWEVKRGRGAIDKVPMMMLPKDHDKIVDFSKLHKDFNFLKDSKARQRFFGALPFHTILPIKDTVVNINRDAFVTASEDTKGKPTDQYVPDSTVCIYFQGGDKAWGNIAQLASAYPDVYLGISSLNDHGEHSPYDFDELIGYTQRKQRSDFDFIVRDPIVAKYKIRSSMTIIRLPLKGESPEIIVVRKGPIGADTLRRHTGHPVRELASAKFASHGHPENVRANGLDERIFQYLREANS